MATRVGVSVRALVTFLLFLPFLLLVLTAAAQANAPSQESFSAYVKQYAEPEFISSNSVAFDARLKLLDMAPKGARVLVAAYAFKNGSSVRRLARHLCLAALRGVRVELLVDSKAGGRPGLSDTFDKGANEKVIEDILQYLANCRAEVYVHNQLDSYVDIFGARLPNFFVDPSMEQRKLGIFHLGLIIRRVKFLMERFNALVEQELARAGVEADPTPVLKGLRGFVINLMLGMGRGANPNASALRRNYDKMILDPIWDSISTEKMRRLLPRIEARFRTDPVFRPLSVKLRRHNRINHRKLFLVESQGLGCMILGGRNLGDHYLIEDKDSFLDGDLLVCRHQSAEIDSVIDAGVSSFEGLKNDLADPYLGSLDDNKVIRIRANKNYRFKSLHFPAGLLPPGAAQDMYEGDLSDAKRSLLWGKKWQDFSAVHGDLRLPDTSGWRLLVTGWGPETDQVRRHLLSLIESEKKEIYIETPYAEFDSGLRSAIESALRRGVKVQLITNSFFTSDGKSPIIRLLMANWTEKTVKSYPNFELRQTALAGGRMLHFKGAAFGCQPGNQRAYLVGSHNFHPRSGNSDKEHALTWNEATDCSTPLASVSLVAARNGQYNELSRITRKRVLDHYPDFKKELRTVKELNQPAKKSRHRLAEALHEMFYEETSPGIWEPRHGERMRRVFDLLDESGLHDLMGRVF